MLSLTVSERRHNTGARAKVRRHNAGQASWLTMGRGSRLLVSGC